MDSRDKLLEDHPNSDDTNDETDSKYYDHNAVNQYTQDSKIYYRNRSRLDKLFGAAFILLFFTTNLSWYWAYRQLSNHKPVAEPARPGYFLENTEPETILVPFSHDWQNLVDLEESPGSYRYGDIHWADWAPVGGGNVAVSQEFQQTFNLDPRASPVKNDSSYFHYLVATFHQQHCLSIVRDTIYQLNGTLTIVEPFLWDHILHCIEAVRQALVCFSDPTLLPIGVSWPGVPNGQEHVCGNRPALRKWASKFEHPQPEFVSNHGITPHTDEWLQRHHGR